MSGFLCYSKRFIIFLRNLDFYLGSLFQLRALKCEFLTGNLGFFICLFLCIVLVVRRLLGQIHLNLRITGIF